MFIVSIKNNIVSNKIESIGTYDDTEEEVNKKYQLITGFSKNIFNLSSIEIEKYDVYSFVNQEEKVIYLVNQGSCKINTDKVPNIAYPIGCCLNTLRYMIIAYKGEKGLSFNKVNTSYNKGGKSLFAKAFSKLFCSEDDHTTILEPLFKKLAINIQKEFLRKNKNNKAYLEHPRFDSSLDYNYVNKEETFKIIEETLDCKMIQPNSHVNHIYKGDCITDEGFIYELKASTYSGPDVSIQTRKDKTSCYVSFQTRHSLDFKEKSEGKNAGYEGYCHVSSCFDLRIRQ